MIVSLSKVYLLKFIPYWMVPSCYLLLWDQRSGDCLWSVCGVETVCFSENTNFNASVYLSNWFCSTNKNNLTLHTIPVTSKMVKKSITDFIFSKASWLNSGSGFKELWVWNFHVDYLTFPILLWRNLMLHIIGKLHLWFLCSRMLWKDETKNYIL